MQKVSTPHPVVESGGLVRSFSLEARGADLIRESSRMVAGRTRSVSKGVTCYREVEGGDAKGTSPVEPQELEDGYGCATIAKLASQQA